MKDKHLPTYMKHAGFTLIESLIVVSVLGFGFLSANKLQSNVVRGKMLSNQQSEALILGTGKMEQLRNYSDMATFDAMANSTDTVNGMNTSYTRTWTVSNQSKHKRVDLTISWTTPGNENQSMMLSSVISATDPMQSGNVFNTSFSSDPLPTPGSQIADSQPVSDPDNPDDGSQTPDSNPTRDELIPGTSITLTYDNQTNNVLKINGEDVVTLSGLVSLATGDSAPANSVSLTDVAVSPQTSNSGSAYCSYTTGTANYSCYVSLSWEGWIRISGVSSVKVCTNSIQEYIGVPHDLTNQNYVLNKTSQSCPTTEPNSYQTL